MNTNSIVMWETLQKQCRLGLFQDSDFEGDLEDSKSTSGGTLCILGSHTFVPISWMCKKQTSISHSSTESEIISLDTGLILDGIPALDLRDLIVLVLGNTTQNHDRTGRPVVRRDKSHVHQRSRGMFNVLNNVDLVPSNVQFSHQEALLYVFEDNEAVIKMIILGRSPTMRHVSRTHRVALYWLFDRINVDPKIQIKYIDTKNQLSDMLTKGNFTRDEWNHLSCLFNISHFSSTVCSEAMVKRVQQDSGEERVTAKSRPMMSLIARATSNLSSSTSESPGKRSYGNQSPWSAKAEREDRTGQPVVDCHKQSTESSFSARYSKWDDDKAWSSQEWKADTSMCDRTEQPVVTSWGQTHESQSSFFRGVTQHDGTAQSVVSEAKPRDRTGQPVVIPQRGARPQQFIIRNDETESELSVESRSFLNRVNDQVRKRHKRSSMNGTENEEEHSMVWGMFMSVTLESAVFMGKNYLDNCHSITNTKDLTLKQMFDISTRFVPEQDETSGLGTIGWENHSWKICLCLVMKELSIFNAQRSTFFQILYCVLVRSSRTPNRRTHGKTDWDGSNHLRFTETLTESTVSQWNSS